MIDNRVALDFQLVKHTIPDNRQVYTSTQQQRFQGLQLGTSWILAGSMITGLSECRRPLCPAMLLVKLLSLNTLQMTRR
jgi:hypothetical protein